MSEEKVKKCFGRMDCLKTGNCAKCPAETRRKCFKKSFEGLEE